MKKQLWGKWELRKKFLSGNDISIINFEKNNKANSIIHWINYISKILYLYLFFLLVVDEMMKFFKGNSMQTFRIKAKQVKRFQIPGYLLSWNGIDVTFFLWHKLVPLIIKKKLLKVLYY